MYIQIFIQYTKSPSVHMKTENVYIPALKESIVFYIGQNAADNFTVIDLMQTVHDIWFHANNGISSCHVVARIDDSLDKKAHRQIVKQGALLCKQHTAKLKSLNHVGIMYAPLHKVAKTHVAGTVTIQDKNGSGIVHV